MPRHAQLLSADLRPYQAEWEKVAAADPNQATRERILQVYQQSCQLSNIDPLDATAFGAFYLYMAKRVTPNTVMTYLGYVAGALRLRTRDHRAVMKAADLAAARHVSPKIFIPTVDQATRVLECVRASPVRQALTLCHLTGARYMDVVNLRSDEIILRKTGKRDLVLTIAWSSMKQRKSYRSRITIDYPPAVADVAPFWDDLSVAAAGGAGTLPFKGTDVTVANVALGRACRRAGIERFTTRAFRQAFAARAGKVAAPGSIHCLTGHVSDAMPNAVYRRAAALNPS